MSANPSVSDLRSSSPPHPNPTIDSSPVTSSPPEPLPPNGSPSSLSSQLIPAPTINITSPTPPLSITIEKQQQPESPPKSKTSTIIHPLTTATESTNASNAVQQQHQQASLIKPSPSQSTIATSSSSSSSSLLKESLSIQSLLSSTSSCNIPLPSPAAITAACSTNTPNPLQTTNVYINGLPPNFKAEQLYALASQFGNVLSCRTFTRQLSDHPSGYGFVLFDTIESAQQCIDVLRSHHNLHPTFAKQAHKINRSPIMDLTSAQSAHVPELAKHLQQQDQQAQQSSSQQPVSPLSNLPLGLNQKVQPQLRKQVGGNGDLLAIGGGDDIYLGGLPMTVDMQALRALISPHTIRNCRFFADMRVSPPCLVAYLQLDSRAAALEVRARLHGRTIRGYSGRLEVTLAEAYDSSLSPHPTPANAFSTVPKFVPSTSASSTSNTATSSNLLLPSSKPNLGLPIGTYPDPSSSSSAVYPNLHDSSLSASTATTTPVLRGRANQQRLASSLSSSQSVYPTPSSSQNDFGMGGLGLNRLNGVGSGQQGSSVDAGAGGAATTAGGACLNANGPLSVEPLLQTLQGIGSGISAGVGASTYKIPPQPHATSSGGPVVIPPQLQPLNNTLNELQMQLENLKPLLAGFSHGNGNGGGSGSSGNNNGNSNYYYRQGYNLNNNNVGYKNAANTNANVISGVAMARSKSFLQGPAHSYSHAAHNMLKDGNISGGANAGGGGSTNCADGGTTTLSGLLPPPPLLHGLAQGGVGAAHSGLSGASGGGDGTGSEAGTTSNEGATTCGGTSPLSNSGTTASAGSDAPSATAPSSVSASTIGLNATPATNLTLGSGLGLGPPFGAAGGSYGGENGAGGGAGATRQGKSVAGVVA